MRQPRDNAIGEFTMRCKKSLNLALLLSFSLLVSVIGCGSYKKNPLVPDIPLDELQAAPLSIQLGDQDYTLETELWRDFMPIAPPGGHPLTALIRVIEQNGEPISADLKAEYLWVLKGDEIWATIFSAETPPLSPQNELHKIARGGPLWETGIEVDAVVGLRLDHGPLELLRAPNQLIARTD